MDSRVKFLIDEIEDLLVKDFPYGEWVTPKINESHKAYLLLQVLKQILEE